jgi:transcriptional regulator with XRE-family HTH domain
LDLSFKAGLSQNQVNYIETGKRVPNLYTLLSICNALQISPAVLFETENLGRLEHLGRNEARDTIIRLVSRVM